MQIVSGASHFTDKFLNDLAVLRFTVSAMPDEHYKRRNRISIEYRIARRLKQSKLRIFVIHPIRYQSIYDWGFCAVAHLPRYGGLPEVRRGWYDLLTLEYVVCTTHEIYPFIRHGFRYALYLVSVCLDGVLICRVPDRNGKNVPELWYNTDRV